MKRLDFVNKVLIGMVHVQALPGTPLHKMSMREITELALWEALELQKYGLDAVILENMHDVPYLNREVGAEVVAAMAVLAGKVREYVDIPIGIQILAGANKAALAVAKAAELDFIRAEGFVYAHVADEGLMNADAGELLRYRKQIGAEDIKIFCDIKKKHSSHALTADVDTVETARTAQFFLADGVIITGSRTGAQADIKELAAVKEAVNIKVLVGSGITAENISAYWRYADGFIVGSYLKKDGIWSNELAADHCRKLSDEVKKLREV